MTRLAGRWMSRREFGIGVVGLGAAALVGQRAPAAESLLIDSHTHTFTRGLPLAANARYQPDYDASYQRLLALSQWVPDPAARRRILVETPARLFRFRANG